MPTVITSAEIGQKVVGVEWFFGKSVSFTTSTVLSAPATTATAYFLT